MNTRPLEENLEKQLFASIEIRDERGVSKLIEELSLLPDTNWEAVNDNGQTFLLAALSKSLVSASYKLFEVLRKYPESVFRLDNQRRNLVWYAASETRLDGLLLDFIAFAKSDAAREYGDKCWLVFDIENTTSLLNATTEINRPAMRALIDACEDGKERWALIARVNIRNETPLYMAIKYGMLDFAGVFLNHGADLFYHTEKELVPFDGLVQRSADGLLLLFSELNDNKKKIFRTLLHKYHLHYPEKNNIAEFLDKTKADSVDVELDIDLQNKIQKYFDFKDNQTSINALISDILAFVSHQNTLPTHPVSSAARISTRLAVAFIWILIIGFDILFWMENHRYKSIPANKSGWHVSSHQNNFKSADNFLTAGILLSSVGVMFGMVLSILLVSWGNNRERQVSKLAFAHILSRLSNDMTSKLIQYDEEAVEERKKLFAKLEEAEIYLQNDHGVVMLLKRLNKLVVHLQALNTSLVETGLPLFSTDRRLLIAPATQAEDRVSYQEENLNETTDNQDPDAVPLLRRVPT